MVTKTPKWARNILIGGIALGFILSGLGFCWIVADSAFLGGKNLIAAGLLFLFGLEVILLLDHQRKQQKHEKENIEEEISRHGTITEQELDKPLSAQKVKDHKKSTHPYNHLRLDQHPPQ